MRTAIEREQDRARVENVVLLYITTQRDRGVLDEDIVTVLGKISAALSDSVTMALSRIDTALERKDRG